MPCNIILGVPESIRCDHLVKDARGMHVFWGELWADVRPESEKLRKALAKSLARQKRLR